MLSSVKDLKDFTVEAIDGPIGRVKDFYFDDKGWIIRYAIVETGNWFNSRKVLVSPIAIGEPDWLKRVLPVSVTKAELRDSPDINTDMPVSRQHEVDFSGYYGYQYYWSGNGYWGSGKYPNLMMLQDYQSTPEQRLAQRASGERTESDQGYPGDAHLRSCRAIKTYHVHASDGDLGHVTGSIVDDQTWAIRYLIVATSNWWRGQQVLIAPEWIEAMDWYESNIVLSMTRQALESAPPYDPAFALDRSHETSLYQHYGRATYWASENPPKAALCGL